MNEQRRINVRPTKTKRNIASHLFKDAIILLLCALIIGLPLYCDLCGDNYGSQGYIKNDRAYIMQAQMHGTVLWYTVVNNTPYTLYFEQVVIYQDLHDGEITAKSFPTSGTHYYTEGDVPPADVTIPPFSRVVVRIPMERDFWAKGIYKIVYSHESQPFDLQDSYVISSLIFP